MTTPLLSSTPGARPQHSEALVQDIRPELHRYCARMIGSVVDAEDVVQDALAKAYASLPTTSVANMRGWLFRIAHNKAIDHLRRASNQRMEHLDEHALLAEPDPPLEEPELVALALSVFLKLAPKQRSCVILKDVMGYSLADISELLDATIPRSKPRCTVAGQGCASSRRASRRAGRRRSTGRSGAAGALYRPLQRPRFRRCPRHAGRRGAAGADQPHDAPGPRGG